jgi:hypothetical protein
MHGALILCLTLPFLAQASTPDVRPLTPAEAIQKVGEVVTVEMTVRASKNALEKRGEIYLDSESDFHDAKNLAAVISRDGAASFREAGVEDPAAHFKERVIRVSGKLILVEGRPRIDVHVATQIVLVEPPDGG